jgi:hypothetical protein
MQPKDGFLRIYLIDFNQFYFCGKNTRFLILVAWLLRSFYHKPRLVPGYQFFTPEEETMQVFWKKFLFLFGLALLLLPDLVWASGEKADLIVIVADTRQLTGWQAWWANLYNESHAYFTALTVVTIPVVGLILGLIADFVMKRIGIDLSSRELAEH